MRVQSFALPVLFALMLISLPAAARTVSLQDPDGTEAACPYDKTPAEADEEAAGEKPVANKRGMRTSPVKSKPAPPSRGNQTTPVRNPRWHRFLPGMFR